MKYTFAMSIVAAFALLGTAVATIPIGDGEAGDGTIYVTSGGIYEETNTLDGLQTEDTEVCEEVDGEEVCEIIPADENVVERTLA